MRTPTNCSNCPREACCNSGMYMTGCIYFPPNTKPIEKEKFSIKEFFGKLFK